MGAWDATPWGNDKAVEWFEGFFRETRAHEFVDETLSQPVNGSNHEQVRAAASLLLFLGRAYTWPIGAWSITLAKASERLREMLLLPIVQTSPDLVSAIKAEIVILETRLARSADFSEDGKRWWQELI